MNKDVRKAFRAGIQKAAQTQEQLDAAGQMFDQAGSVRDTFSDTEVAVSNLVQPIAAASQQGEAAGDTQTLSGGIPTDGQAGQYLSSIEGIDSEKIRGGLNDLFNNQPLQEAGGRAGDLLSGIKFDSNVSDTVADVMQSLDMTSPEKKSQ